MNDMFDINLLSQIQALDRKMSLANEKPRLRRKTGDEPKHKGNYWSQSKVFKNVAKNTDDPAEGTEGLHASIDITV